MPTTLPSRLRRITRSMRWTQAQLAAAVGASKSTVSRWFADGEIGMEPRFAFRLQDVSGFSARWILLGEGEPKPALVDLSDLPELVSAEYVRHVHVMRRILATGKRGKA